MSNFTLLTTHLYVFIHLPRTFGWHIISMEWTLWNYIKFFLYQVNCAFNSCTKQIENRIRSNFLLHSLVQLYEHLGLLLLSSTVQHADLWCLMSSFHEINLNLPLQYFTFHLKMPQNVFQAVNNVALMHKVKSMTSPAQKQKQKWFRSICYCFILIANSSWDKQVRGGVNVPHVFTQMSVPLAEQIQFLFVNSRRH